MASVDDESGVANKKLQALKVSLTKTFVSPVVLPPMTPGRQQAHPQPVDRASVLAMADLVSALPASAAVESIPPVGLPPVSPAVAVAAPSASVDASAASKVVASGEDAVLPDGYVDAVRGYRIALASHAKRFRLYPPAAREMGIGGRSEIEIVVPVASSPEFLVRQSSGHEELDRAALEMLRRSVEQVELPTLLKGRRLSIFLPVEFLPPP